MSSPVALAEAPSAVSVRAAERSLPGAYRLAGYVLGDAGEAEDATQDALVRAWLHRSELRDADRFSAWFDRIVVNVCRDRLRSRRGVKTLALDERIGTLEPGLLGRDRGPPRDEVGRAVRVLDADHLVVVALRFWRDLSLDEIAERLGLPLGTVKSRLHYALRSLRVELEREAREVKRRAGGGSRTMSSRSVFAPWSGERSLRCPSGCWCSCAGCPSSRVAASTALSGALCP